MNILITGASGFLGRELVNVFSNTNHNLILCTRDKRKLQDMPQPVMSWDEPIPSGTEAVIHCAAKTPGADFTLADHCSIDFFAANVKRTDQILQKAKKAGVDQFVLVSSHAVSETFRHDAYSESKREAEKLVRHSGMNWVIVRPAGIYGLNNHWVNLIRRYQKKNWIVINGDGSYPLCYIYVEDCALNIQTIVENMDRDMMPQVIELCTQEHLTYRRMLEDVRKVTNAGFRIINRPLWILEIAAGVIGIVHPETRRKMVRIRQQYISEPFEPVNESPLPGCRPFSEGFRLMYEQGIRQGLF